MNKCANELSVKKNQLEMFLFAFVSIIWEKKPKNNSVRREYGSGKSIHDTVGFKTA